MVALVDHDKTVLSEEVDVRLLLSPGQRLNRGDVDHPAEAVASSAHLADLAAVEPEVLLQPCLPLFGQGLTIDEDEGWHAVAGDEGTGHDCLAFPRRSDEHAQVVGYQLGDGRLLLRAEGPAEPEIDGARVGPRVGDRQPAAGLGDDLFDLRA